MAVTQNSLLLWKQRYHVTLHELQAKERHWRELEGTLRLLATWLILAADRCDKTLNHRLESLRVALRSDYKGGVIKGLISDISEGVARIERYRKAHSTELDAKATFKQLLGVLPVPEPLFKDRDQLMQRIERLSSEEELGFLSRRFASLVDNVLAYERAALDRGRALVTPQDADEHEGVLDAKSFCLALLEEVLELSASADLQAPVKRYAAEIDACQDGACARRPLITLLTRALEADSDSRRCDGLSTVLLGLLDQLELPGNFEPQVRVLRERLFGGIPRDRIETTISDIADLVLRARLALEREKEDIERFLSGLSRQLVELDHFLGITARSQDELLRRRQVFGDRLNADFSEMAESVEEAVALDVIRSTIREKLGEIQLRLEHDRGFERQCGEQQRAEMEKLKRRLSQLEQETGELRERVRIEKDKARCDALTRLPNRAAFDERIAQECDRWSRNGNPLSIAILDIDCFKKINDAYGHKTGDRVLKTVGELLASRVRVVDFVARYGGEEFVVVMPGTSASDALRLIEKLRVEVGACRFRYREDVIPVTLSAGIAQIARGDTPDAFFERADEALYRAKSEGRNRCAVAAPEENRGRKSGSEHN